MPVGAVGLMVNETLIRRLPPPLAAKILKPVVASAVVAGLATALSTPVELLNETLLAAKTVLTLDGIEKLVTVPPVTVGLKLKAAP